MTRHQRALQRAVITSIPDQPSITHHFADFGGSNASSFEVRYPGGRKFFHYDGNAGRRAVTGKMSKEQAFAQAQSFHATVDRAGRP